MQSWFKSRQQDNPSKIASSTNVPKNVSMLPEACLPTKERESSQEPRGAFLDMIMKLLDIGVKVHNCTFLNSF